MKKFNITHESGYYRNPKHLPSVAGIYLVYKCNYNSSNDTVDIQDILYIGESENIHERHNGTEDQPRQHEHYCDFAAQAGGAEHICYGVVRLPNESADERKWLQDALILMQQPPINTEAKNSYNHLAAEIETHAFPDVLNMKHFTFLFDYGTEIEDKHIMNKIKPQGH